MTVKNELLRELEQNRGNFIKGQELADRLGVSRNSVWKAIKQLQEEGYVIDSVTNRGYRLDMKNDVISEEGIRLFLPMEYQQLPICVYETIDSTNDEAKRRLTAGEKHNLLVVSEEQTQGHGRRGRNFYSPSKSGIYMSLLVHTDAGVEDSVSITTAASVVIVNAIRELTGLEPVIKWVNDIYLNNKKICGILTEAILNLESGEAPGIIVGVGLNVSTSKFPRELKDTATSLGKHTSVTRNQLIATIVQGLMLHAENVTDRAYLEAYRRYSMVIGKDIVYSERDEMVPAHALGIDDNGGLMIELPDGGMKVLSSGEITIRLSDQK